MVPGRSTPVKVTFQCLLFVSIALLSVTLAEKSESSSQDGQTPAQSSSNSSNPLVASSRVGEIARIRIVYGNQSKPKSSKQADKSTKEKYAKTSSKEVADKPKSASASSKQQSQAYNYATIEPVASGSVSRVRIYSGKVPPRPRPPPPQRPKLIIRPHGPGPHPYPRPRGPPKPQRPPRIPVTVTLTGPGPAPTPVFHAASPSSPPSGPAPALTRPEPQPEPVYYSPPPQEAHPDPQPTYFAPPPQPPPPPVPEKLEVYVVSEEQVRNGPVILKSSAESQSYAPASGPVPLPVGEYEGGFRNYPSSAATAARAQFPPPQNPFDYSYAHEFEHEQRQHSSSSFKYDRPGTRSHHGHGPSMPMPPGFQPQQQIPGELSDSFGLSSYDRRPRGPGGQNSVQSTDEYDYTQGREQAPPRIPVPVRSHDGAFTNMHAPIPGRNSNGLAHPTYTKNYWLSGLNTPQVILEDLKIIDDSITLSGFSSGGGMAQQMFMSYPSLFRGIGVFQSTYYRCGRGNGDINEFDATCTALGNHSQAYDPNIAINDINAYFHNGLIEDPRNLRDKLLYLYAGLQNEIFRPEQMLNTIRIFEPYIGNRFRIRTRVQDAANLLPTDNFGGPCSESGAENHFLGNCHLNGPFEALGFLLGEDIIKLPDETVKPDLNSLLEFDQTEFFGQDRQAQNFMARTGYLYVPDRCGPNGNVRCHFHVYFHGCRTGREYNDGNHIRNSGFLQLAELNDVIVLFPQVLRHARNPLGCWDTYGYTGPLYATQKGVQVDVIRRMLARVLGQDDFRPAPAGGGGGSDGNGDRDNELAPVPV